MPTTRAAAGQEDVLEALHTVTHALRSGLQRARPDGQHGLTPLELRALSYFARHPGATPSDLALHSGRDKGQLARLLGALKERGLLQSEADPDDRRAQRLSLTAVGAEQVQAMQAERRRLAAHVAAGLDAAERRELVRLLALVEARIRDAGP